MHKARWSNGLMRLQGSEVIEATHPDGRIGAADCDGAEQQRAKGIADHLWSARNVDRRSPGDEVRTTRTASRKIPAHLPDFGDLKRLKGGRCTV